MRYTIRIFLLLLIMLPISFSIHAENDTDNQDLSEPEDCGGHTQLELNFCTNERFVKYDKELNIVYKLLKNSLSKSDQKILLKEQRAWLDVRDSNCYAEANADAEGGSMWPSFYNDCRAKSTLIRTKQLKQWEK